jgi:hypothetical protein
MIDVSNKKNPITGYMGYIPNEEEKNEGQGGHLESHIPGYVGYIPSVKAENLYAHTYGKITEDCAKKSYPKGIELPPEVKYKSTAKDTYVDPNQIKTKEAQEGKISGVKLSTFSSAAKYIYYCM